MDVEKTASRIARAAVRMGYANHTITATGKPVEYSLASTGSAYIELCKDGVGVRVRVSDHAEAHVPIRRRQISVDPETGLSQASAIEALRDPKSIEIAEIDPEVEKMRIEYESRMVEREEYFGKQWRAVRERLTSEHREMWVRLGKNRTAARRIAEASGEKVSYVYAALTGGKKFDRVTR